MGVLVVSFMSFGVEKRRRIAREDSESEKEEERPVDHSTPSSHAPAGRSVLAVAEMNLEEYPAFRLGRRSKRPEIRYVRSRAEADGRTFEQVWVVRGAEGLGLPGPFEQDLYVALLVLFTEQGLPSDGRIRFTRNRLAQIMDCSNSGRGYELIEQGLDRLAGATIHTEHAFYRPGALGSNGERSGPAERLSLSFHILEEVRVYERRAAIFDNEGSDFSSTAKRSRVEHARPLELSLARLGLPLVQSYERRYTKALDATFYFALTRPLAKRLYRYVDKVRNGRGSFEIGLRALADVLGLEYRYPSDIKDGLVEAHAELEAHGYLASAGYAPLAGGPAAGEKVVYAFQGAFDRVPRRASATRQIAAPASPLQAELESFGISPKRAAALIAGHPEDHIAARMEYVRALTRTPEGRRVKNPAGYLARAIEESYTVPVTPGAPPPVTPSRHEVHQRSPVSGASESHDTAAGARPAGGSERSAVAAPSEPAGGSALSAEAMDDQPAAAQLAGPWGPLATALKERLTGATYAAWILPAQPVPQDDAESTGETQILTLRLPNTFTLDRWRRPPIAPALAEASATLDIAVSLEVTTSDA
jgi:hypothetical protein